MTDLDVATLHTWVVLGAFALATLFGFVAARTDFCTMGAITDIVGMHSWDRMRMWVAAIAIAILGTSLLGTAGLLDTSRTIYTSPRLPWLSALVGGGMFGFGMVLASGCGSKTLIRIGQGNLRSLVVFVVMATFASMSMRGLFAVWRVATVDAIALQLSANQDVGSLVASVSGITRATAQECIGAFAATALLLWVFAARAFRMSELKREIVAGGFTVGAVVVAFWYLTGHIAYVAEDPQTLQEAFVGTSGGRPESLTFVAPLAATIELFTLWSDRSLHVNVGIAAVGGTVLGSLSHALISRSFRWEGFQGAADTAHHLLGAALMGIGGVTALGCTIGQGITGVSTLALGSMLALASIIGGAVLATHYQMWRIERTY